jgi:uncharacterized protein (TIGR02265 family)
MKAVTPGPGGGYIKHSVLEGLFKHMVPVQPGTPFAAALRGAGYDVTRPEPVYSSAVLQNVLAVAGRELFPERTPPEAQREVGRLFVSGFFKTLAGRTVGVLLPVFGAEGLIKQLPRFFLTGNNSSVVTVSEQGERTWHFELRDPYPSVEFAAGIIESVMQRSGLKPEVTVAVREAERFVLRIAW